MRHFGRIAGTSRYRLGLVLSRAVRLCLAFAVLFLIAGVLSLETSSNAAPISSEPTLVDPSALAVTALASGWSVHRGVIIDPTEFSDGDCKAARNDVPVELVNLPDIWGPNLTTNIATGHGYATYCLDLHLTQTGIPVALQIRELRSAYAVYALIEQSGRYHEPELLARTRSDPRVPDLTASGAISPAVMLPNSSDRIRLIVQVSNHIHKQGGFVGAPIVGEPNIIASMQRRGSAIPTALVLVLCVVIVGILALGRQRTQFAGALIFASLCFASALRVFLVSDLIWDFWPNLPLARKYDLEYMSMFALAAAYYAFIANLLREGQRHWYDWFCYAICGTMALASVFVMPFLPAGTITLIREPFQLFTVILAVIAAYIVWNSLASDSGHRREGAIVALAAIATTGFEIAVSLKLISASMEMSQLLVLFVTGMHARAYAISFNRVNLERTHLTTRLEHANLELRDQAEALQKSAAAAEEASQAKSDFLATMSHELRTPLNAIIGYSEMMNQEILGVLGNDKYKEYSGDIHASGVHLLSLVNDILDLSSVESGSDQLFEDTFDLRDVAMSVQALTANQAAAAEVTFECKIPEDFPELYADQRKIKQVLVNLVSNAIKFNKSGGRVILEAHCNQDDLLILVRDTGIGMKQEDIPKALTKFGQVDSNHSRRYDGIGLGLPIVRAIVERHGGTLSIESELGNGTCVSVRLPSNRCAPYGVTCLDDEQARA